MEKYLIEPLKVRYWIELIPIEILESSHLGCGRWEE
jgi:hypothetical protein